ncbi:PD-(D/E)XK nuclease family protein [Streptomyces sp. Tu6071]|uniref:PD-(D/E)XK nuclease family protein n=1 Tax=Streptomyces sp. Tu6071 TaxID=355249 RepID=UPI001F3B9344|nr:PD-(D/E)XK nuclease family protein [Streptomyces sp. Tu6071]
MTDADYRGRVETMPRSVSQTEQYEKCAWQFYLQRVERVVPRPAAWSAHGTAFHSAAEALERSGGSMTLEEAVQAFSDQYSALINKGLAKEANTDLWMSAGPYSGGEDIERRYILGQEQTARYVEWWNENKPEIWMTPSGDLAIELYFITELGGVKVRGYIDLITLDADDNARVRDLKTGTTKSKFQLETYKTAIEKIYNVPVQRGDWYFGKTGGLSRPLALDQVSEYEVGQRFANMDAGVKRGDFPANPGYDCNFCDVSHACSVAQIKR